MNANYHKVCAHSPDHNLAHNLAHNPFDNLVVTSIVPSKGELTSSLSSSMARTPGCLDESTLVGSLYIFHQITMVFWDTFEKLHLVTSLAHICLFVS